MTVDPGWNTGICNWTSVKKHPLRTTCLKINYKLRTKKTMVETKLSFMIPLFKSELAAFKPREVYIEGVGMWGGAISHASAARGDTFGLAFLVGAYFQCCKEMSIVPHIVKVQDWKGQMSDDVVIERVRMATDKVFASVHETCAVGIGLSKKGLL